MDMHTNTQSQYSVSIFPGESTTQSEQSPSLGTLAQDSINRDPDGFVKDLKERAGVSSSLQQLNATDITVETFDLPEFEEGEAFPQITKTPTKKPASLPGTVLEEQDSSNTNEGRKDNILAILAFIIGAFL